MAPARAYSTPEPASRSGELIPACFRQPVRAVRTADAGRLDGAVRAGAGQPATTRDADRVLSMTSRLTPTPSIPPTLPTAPQPDCAVSSRRAATGGCRVVSVLGFGRTVGLLAARIGWGSPTRLLVMARTRRPHRHHRGPRAQAGHRARGQALKQRTSFGLVFERHLPENVLLRSIGRRRLGDHVQLRDASADAASCGSSRATTANAVLVDDDGEQSEVAVEDLFVVNAASASRCIRR